MEREGEGEAFGEVNEAPQLSEDFQSRLTRASSALLALEAKFSQELDAIEVAPLPTFSSI